MNRLGLEPRALALEPSISSITNYHSQGPPTFDKPTSQNITVGLVDKEVQAVSVDFGGPCRGRTYGPLIKSQLLYQLS